MILNDPFDFSFLLTSSRNPIDRSISDDRNYLEQDWLESVYYIRKLGKEVPDGAEEYPLDDDFNYLPGKEWLKKYEVPVEDL